MSHLIGKPAPSFTAQAVLPDHVIDETLSMVDAPGYHEKHGEVCPANWREGEEAMAPNPEWAAAHLRKHAA